MEIKNRPISQAANSDTHMSDTKPTNISIQPFRRTPKKHRARVYMLRTGVEGWTENDILRYCRLSSGRNYASEIERCLDIQLERIDEKNPDGIGAHLRYRQHLKARINAAGRFTAMCEALELARMEQGKATQRHHYTNESNMLSRIVLGGLTAKQWAQTKGVEGEPRDSMNAEQLEHLAYLESTNITLIDMGMEFDQRKAELTRLSQRWMAKHLEVAHD